MKCQYRKNYECIEEKPTKKICKICLNEQLCIAMGKNIDVIQAARAAGLIADHGAEGYKAH